MSGSIDKSLSSLVGKVESYGSRMESGLSGAISRAADRISTTLNNVISKVNGMINNINSAISGIERGFTFSYNVQLPNGGRRWGNYSMSLFNKIKSIFNSSFDDVPDAQTIYFKNGEMYKVYPTDKESWYDARYLVSDGVKYDLENLDDLKRIPVPKFPTHQNIMDGYGVTGNLDYVLRMKAGSFYNRKDKIRCSACLWKCTELMFAHPFLSWDESHFYRIVQWHVEMGMFDEADKAEKYIYSVLDHDANYQQLINHIKDNPEYIKQQEAFHKKNSMRKEYYHIFYELPELAPKSFSAYSRMKNAQTKNFLKLKEQAIKHGISIS